MYGSEKRQQVGSQLDQELKRQKNDKTRDSNTLGDKELDKRNASRDSKKEPEENKEYLAKYKGSKMTVVFHAVLSRLENVHVTTKMEVTIQAASEKFSSSINA